MRPRRLTGASGRPLNSTVRSHFGELSAAKNLGMGAVRYSRCEAPGDRRVLLRASSLDATGVRVRLLLLRVAVGARANAAAVEAECALAPRSLRLRSGRAELGEYVTLACRGGAACAQCYWWGAF
jgi:hypothetical protein